MKTKEEAVQNLKAALVNLNLAIDEVGKHDVAVKVKQEWHPLANIATPNHPLSPSVSAEITETVTY